MHFHKQCLAVAKPTRHPAPGEDFSKVGSRAFKRRKAKFADSIMSVSLPWKP
jgi:hypothetical protein